MNKPTMKWRLGKSFHLLFIVLAVAFCFLAGCRPEPSNLAPFDGQKAFAEVESLIRISPRDAGTPGARQAAEHILLRLESFGVKAEIDTFTDQTPTGKATFHNVIGRIPGKTGKWIVLGSHFDTMPGIPDFQGANDGGSSTGILLEIARMLAGHRPETGIMLAFFDGEEGIAGYGPNDGLHGSRHMVEALVESGQIKDIDSMILLDMVGDKDLDFTIPCNSSNMLIKEALDAAHATGQRKRFSLLRDLAVTDDHQPFLDAGVPAIDLIDFHYGSAPGLNDYWHTPNDILEHIDAQSLGITGNVVLQMVRDLASVRSPDKPPLSPSE